MYLDALSITSAFCSGGTLFVHLLVSNVMSNLKNVLVYFVRDVWFDYVYKFVFRGPNEIFWGRFNHVCAWPLINKPNYKRLN